jgi:hypothetical protein
VLSASHGAADTRSKIENWPKIIGGIENNKIIISIF